METKHNQTIHLEIVTFVFQFKHLDGIGHMLVTHLITSLLLRGSNYVLIQFVHMNLACTRWLSFYHHFEFFLSKSSSISLKMVVTEDANNLSVSD